MDVTKARQIILETIDGRKRWGKMFRSEHDLAYILDALVHLDSEGTLAFNTSQDQHSEELTKTKRQLTAALAREAKQKKQIESLKHQVDHMATTERPE